MDLYLALVSSLPCFIKFMTTSKHFWPLICLLPIFISFAPLYWVSDHSFNFPPAPMAREKAFVAFFSFLPTLLLSLPKFMYSGSKKNWAYIFSSNFYFFESALIITSELLELQLLPQRLSNPPMLLPHQLFACKRETDDQHKDSTTMPKHQYSRIMASINNQQWCQARRVINNAKTPSQLCEICQAVKFPEKENWSTWKPFHLDFYLHSWP